MGTPHNMSVFPQTAPDTAQLNCSPSCSFLSGASAPASVPRSLGMCTYPRSYFISLPPLDLCPPDVSTGSLAYSSQACRSPKLSWSVASHRDVILFPCILTEPPALHLTSPGEPITYRFHTCSCGYWLSFPCNHKPMLRVLLGH